MVPIVSLKSKVLAATCLAVAIAGAWFGVRAVMSWRDEAQLAQLTRKMLDVVAVPEGAGFQARADAVRAFVNDHSAHRLNAEFQAIADDPVTILRRLLDHAQGRSDVPVPLECSRRSAIVARALSQLGYETRFVWVYDTRRDLASHTFVEVLNPQSRRWEVEDADYDIYWRDTRSGERVSPSYASRDLTALEPCGRSGCGWDIESRERLRASKLKTYFDVLTVADKKNNRRFSVYTPRADLARAFTVKGKSGSYCDVLSSNCRNGFSEMAQWPPPEGTVKALE